MRAQSAARKSPPEPVPPPTELEAEKLRRIKEIDGILGKIFNEQNAIRHELRPSDEIPLSDLRSLTPDNYESVSPEDRKRLLTHLTAMGGEGIPEFLRQHLRLFSQSGDVAVGPTLDVRDAKLQTSIQGAMG